MGGTLVTSVRAGARFVERTGVALVFPTRDLDLPSLWEAAIGTPELTAFITDEQGKRHLAPELDRVWELKNRLAEQRRACLGAYVRGRLTLLSPTLLPAFYALTGRSGRVDDFREVAGLSSLERRLCEALLEAGPSTAPELRMLIGGSEAKVTKRAIANLQRQRILTQAGEVDQDQGWAAAVFDLLPRRYADHLSALPRRDEALDQLVSVLRVGVPNPSAADLAAILPLTRAEAAAALRPAG